MIKELGIAILLCAFAVAPTWAEPGCPGTNQVEMNECAAASFKKADAELNKLYKMQIDRLEDEDAKQRLRDAQRAWIAFRDTACLYEAGPPDESGSIWALEHFSCLNYHTRKRIEDMKEYLACDSPPCPE